MLSVLLIDDNPQHRFLTRSWLEAGAEAFSVFEASTAESGLELISAGKPDCVVLDYILPPSDGLQVLNRLRDFPVRPPVILLTCGLTDELRRNALALGASACLDKSKSEGPDVVHAVMEAILRRNSGQTAGHV